MARVGKASWGIASTGRHRTAAPLRAPVARIDAPPGSPWRLRGAPGHGPSRRWPDPPVVTARGRSSRWSRSTPRRLVTEPSGGSSRRGADDPLALAPLAAVTPRATWCCRSLGRDRCSSISVVVVRGLAFLADLLSRPVLVGDRAGVVVIIIVGRAGKPTGVAVDGDRRSRGAVVRRAASATSTGPRCPGGCCRAGVPLVADGPGSAVPPIGAARDRVRPCCRWRTRCWPWAMIPTGLPLFAAPDSSASDVTACFCRRSGWPSLPTPTRC